MGKKEKLFLNHSKISIMIYGGYKTTHSTKVYIEDFFNKLVYWVSLKKIFEKEKQEKKLNIFS